MDPLTNEQMVDYQFCGGCYDGLSESKPAAQLEQTIKLPISRAFIAATSRDAWRGKPKITGYAYYTLQWQGDDCTPIVARYVYRGRVPA